MTYTRELVTFLILLTLLVGMGQSYFQLVGAFEEQAVTLMEYEGPIWIKALKDICIVVLFLLCLTSRAGGIGLGALVSELSMVLLIVVLFVASVESNGWAIASAGIRWFLPILLMFWMRRLSEQPDPTIVGRFLVACLVANVIFQAVQLVTFPPIYGLRDSGLVARVPGFFLLPNTTAFFASVCAAFAVVHFRGLFTRIGVLALAMTSTLLAQSGTGVLCLVVLFAYLAARRHFGVFLLLSIPSFVATFGVLDAVVGRDAYLEISGGDRLEKLKQVLAVGALSIENFGIFTNTGVLLQARYTDTGGGAVITDSFYISILGNLGALTIPFLLLAFAYVRSTFVGMEIRNVMPTLIVYGGFSFSTIVTEAFPMNLLLAVLLWSKRGSGRKTAGEIPAALPAAYASPDRAGA